MNISVFGFAIKTASIPAASAVLNNAPMFPGFSGASATKIKGFFEVNLKFSIDNSFVFEIAIIPSVVSRKAIFLYTSLETSIISTADFISEIINSIN